MNKKHALHLFLTLKKLNHEKCFRKENYHNNSITETWSRPIFDNNNADSFFANRPLCFEVTPFKMKYDKSTCNVHPHKRPKKRSHAWHTTQTVNVDVAEKMPLNIDGINFSIQILKIEYSNTIISSVTVASSKNLSYLSY